MAKASTLKGTRDFLPAQIARRNYLFDTIQQVFKKYGFAAIETPAMEHSETLLGKYGEEGDKLLFRLLNNGDFMDGVDCTQSSATIASSISKRALRYDLTVPFARFVAQHRNELSFPFKRYQIQPVWRADRPQKGRYQEFFQCDADVVGSDALLHEVEFILIFDEVLSKLGLESFTVKINNRKILAGLAEIAGHPDRIKDIAISLDKLDKVGKDKVIEEWKERGIDDEAIKKLSVIFDMKEGRISGALEEILSESEIGTLGIQELKSVIKKAEKLGLRKAKLEFDVTLARGLDYYTGAIFEVVSEEVAIGSICGGGRYDDLTGIFGFPDMPGVGISFGADRIYDVLDQLERWPSGLEVAPQIIFMNFGDTEADYCMSVLKDLRDKEISAELYPTSAKMKKQMKYADDRGIRYVALVGSKEMEEGKLTIKDMKEGSQQSLTKEELVNFLSKNRA
jgi:histidyl-tRNA synthetase